MPLQLVVISMFQTVHNAQIQNQEFTDSCKILTNFCFLQVTKVMQFSNEIHPVKSTINYTA